MEWSNQNALNSFNSAKGLCYFESYKKIVDWMDGKSNYLPPPRECNLDPIAECNARCGFCIVQRYLRNNPAEVGEMRVLPTDYIYRLIDFLANWGVKGLCLSGGGDPSLHKDIAAIIVYAKGKGLDVSLFTNGIKMSQELIEALMLCRFVTLSVDSSSKEEYATVKGVDKFESVLRNITRLVNKRRETGSKLFDVMRMVILQENQYTISRACQLAKDLGVSSFNVRPVDMERSDIIGHKKLQLDVPKIQEQFALCHEMETPYFKVFTTSHKFDVNFHNKHDFKECLATPLLIPVLTDGNFYACVDTKMEEKFRLGSAFPDPSKILEVWGSDKHREFLKSIAPLKDCGDRRCTFQAYHKQISEAVKEDSMCLSFP